MSYSMFGYSVYSVIRKNQDTGIICAIDGHRFRIMFETADNGVEFVWYPLSAVSKYEVVG